MILKYIIIKFFLLIDKTEDDGEPAKECPRGSAEHGDGKRHHGELL